jgi:hypothetical protein
VTAIPHTGRTVRPFAQTAVAALLAFTTHVTIIGGTGGVPSPPNIFKKRRT